MITYTLSSLGAAPLRGQEDWVQRILDMPISGEDYHSLIGKVDFIGVTDQFIDVLKTFKCDDCRTPAGFEPVLKMDKDKVLRICLKRNISFDKNGQLRPTRVLFSADSANPYEVAPISPLLANLTCNPGIIYDLFINNPKANVGNKFKTRDEVMEELANILSPGVDISVELNNPFEKDFGKILEEAAKFREMLSKYRVVIKVPHTGPVSAQNVQQLLEGSKKLDRNFTDVSTDGAFLGHNLALKLHEEGYRVNFTLMFEPYQTQLALQARPYFINSFVRHRLVQSQKMDALLRAYDESKNQKALEDLRLLFIDNDYFAPAQADMDLKDVENYARDLIAYRHFHTPEGSDGLDSMRHNLRLLKNCNMEDTRLIVCSMEGPKNYPDIDKLLCEPEFQDMHHRVVITAEPNYLARFTSTNQVISYQRRFMNAAEGES